MLCLLALALLLFSAAPSPASTPQLGYALRVDPHDLSGVQVELRIRNAPASLQLAAHAHPEYDDKYWRHLEGFEARDASGVSIPTSRVDSVRWNVANKAGDVVIRYRVRFPGEDGARASWRPFLSATGGLVGGPHSFLYVIGLETLPASVTLDIPEGWRVGTGLPGASTSRAFHARDMHTLMESPMLVGALREWQFRIRNTPHRVFYWPLPNATPFDTVAYVAAIEKFARATVDLFNAMPYNDYTFLVQDGAYSGGLEHPNSVTLGGMSADLARDPYATLTELAHEFVHTWNLMAIKPAEYRTVDYRVQPPVSALWFSEGLTIYYADLLLRRAGLPTNDSTRTAHLETLIERYLSAPGNAKFSAEAVSRVEYNASPTALGDYTASSHLQGELLGTVLDLIIRDSTNGTRSMDDVMRLMYTRFRSRGFTGRDVQQAVNETCGCRSDAIFDRHVRNGNPIEFDRYLLPVGLRVDTSRVPAVASNGTPTKDLRIWGWMDEQNVLRLRISDPSSVWGQAGLHTGDVLVSINGNAVRTWPELRTFLINFPIGDSATLVVQRNSETFRTTVVMQGLMRPVARVVTIPGSSERQRRLRAAWAPTN